MPELQVWALVEIQTFVSVFLTSVFVSLPLSLPSNGELVDSFFFFFFKEKRIGVKKL